MVVLQNETCMSNKFSSVVRVEKQLSGNGETAVRIEMGPINLKAKRENVECVWKILKYNLTHDDGYDAELSRLREEQMVNSLDERGLE